MENNLKSERNPSAGDILSSSLLYVPGWNAAAIQSARSLPCRGLIVCLEDATPKERKHEAREIVVRELKEGFATQRVAVRVNGLETQWGADDLDALKSSKLDAILAPSVRNAEDVRSYDRRLGAASELWVMIETASAVLELTQIAAAASDTRLSTLVLGTNDLARELHARPNATRDVFLPIFTSAVAAARHNGLAIYDGIFMNIEDDAGLRAQCEQGFQFGFDGKTLFHPRQIDICNSVFGARKTMA